MVLSYDQGVSSHPLLGRTIGDHFSMIAAANPERAAVIACEQDKTYTYRQLKERVDLLARGLIRLGIERGDRVGIWSTNNVQWLMTQLAAAQVGAILVNINPAYRTHELEYALRQSGVKLLVVIPKFKSSDYLSMLNGLVHNIFCPDGEHDLSCLPELKHVVVIGNDVELQGKLMSFDRVLAMGGELPKVELERRMAELQFDDPINIQYTSGTTGLPKGVTLSHHNIINNALLTARAMELDGNSLFAYRCRSTTAAA